jgi:hypothetical protein
MLNILNRPVTPEDALKGAQLARGRTSAKVKTLEEALMAAQAAAAVLAKEEADSVADSDVLPTTSSKALQKAQDQVRLIESGLAVARQRDRDAQTALSHAQLLLSVAQEERAFAHLKNDVAPKADRLFAEIEVYIEELASAIDGVRAVSGAGHHQSFLIDLTLGFEMLFLRAAQKIIPKGRAHVVSLGDRTFASLVPDPSTVAKRRGVEK